MAAPSGTGRSRLTFALLVLVSITLVTLDFRNFGPLESVQSGLRTVFEPVRSGVDRVSQPFENGWNALFDYDDLRAENADLRAELDQARGEIIQSRVDREVLDELLVEADIELRATYDTVVARVTGGPVGNFSDHRLSIDKGSADGLAEGMAVVTNAGLIGRLERVDRSSSQIQLLSDPDFAVGVRVGGEIGLARGDRSASVMVIEQGIADDAEIEIGDPVLTSGGVSVFPPGLLIGTIGDVASVEGGRGLRLDLAVVADLDRVQFVNIVLWSQGDAAPDAVPTTDATDPAGDPDAVPTTDGTDAPVDPDAVPTTDGTDPASEPASDTVPASEPEGGDE